MDVKAVKMGRRKKGRTEEVGVKTGHVSCRMRLRTAQSPPELGGGEQALYITAVRVLWCGCSSPCPITDSNSIDDTGTKVQPQPP